MMSKPKKSEEEEEVCQHFSISAVNFDMPIPCLRSVKEG
jgi:hypothetical protein